jgi:hypothetical protein
MIKLLEDRIVGHLETVFAQIARHEHAQGYDWQQSRRRAQEHMEMHRAKGHKFSFKTPISHQSKVRKLKQLSGPPQLISTAAIAISEAPIDFKVGDIVKRRDGKGGKYPVIAVEGNDVVVGLAQNDLITRFTFSRLEVLIAES